MSAHKTLTTLAAIVCALVVATTTTAQTSTTGTTPPPSKNTCAKKATVKTGTATVVTDTASDSGPKLISTTEGKGASSNAWTNFAALQKAADEKNPDACYELGLMYLNGSSDTPQNTTAAVTWLEEAASRNHTAANFRLGKLYADGNGVPQNSAMAFNYYTVAARAGDPIAQHNVGAMLSSGRGVKRDYPEGLAWLILAAKKNSDAAESEKKLRDFLAKYPKTISKGETRAEALEQELAEQNAPTPEAPAKPNMPAPQKIEMAPIPSQTMPIPELPLTEQRH